MPEDPDVAPFYEATSCDAPTDWVTAHVLPVLDTTPIPREELSDRLGAYLAADAEPVLVADWPEDLAHALCLTVTGPGRRLVTPRLRLELLEHSLFATAGKSAMPHNALHDAVALRAHVLAVEALR